MPKGPKGEKRPADGNARAVHIAKIATGEIEESGYTVPNRKKSGTAGAKARANLLCAGRRTEIAKRAARARWKEKEGVK